VEFIRAEERDGCSVLVNVVINLKLHKMLGISSLAEQTWTSQENCVLNGVSFIGVVLVFVIILFLQIHSF
jgi:hypothetical protein